MDVLQPGYCDEGYPYGPNPCYPEGLDPANHASAYVAAHELADRTIDAANKRNQFVAFSGGTAATLALREIMQMLPPIED